MNIGEMQRKLSLWAEQDKERKFYGLFKLICDVDWLRVAHAHVEQNTGSKTAGCDGVNMSAFNEDLELNLVRLSTSLQDGTFVPCPVRRVYIPKANGKIRPLGIPTIRDRIVQEAVRMVLEPIFEADFSRLSFGFRPNRCTMDAAQRLYHAMYERFKYFWVIEGDIASYFDTICHRKLMKLLGRRVEDGRLLDLLWGFLRAGVMERRLFKDTLLGTPQGGIVSPLLANVYLHELDRYMERYTDLPQLEKARRRSRRIPNFVYVRYADDFVVLCNGTREQAEAMKAELHQFLSESLRLTLSLEKTKVTHLDDGFDFLGFNFKRGTGSKGRPITRMLISQKSIKKHLDTIQAATSPSSSEMSFAAKLLAMNRIIEGWCRYFQYTSKATAQFGKVSAVAYWLLARWVARKRQATLAQVLRQYSVAGSLGWEGLHLTRHDSFKTLRYRKRFAIPNPYTTQEVIVREEMPDGRPWLGQEERPGMADLRRQALERDGYRCRSCGTPVDLTTSECDHIRPVHRFRRPVDANTLENLETLCIPCHEQKTGEDRRMESRMQ
jgi:group II intron reverse transcriptase/maturase